MCFFGVLSSASIVNMSPFYDGIHSENPSITTAPEAKEEHSAKYVCEIGDPDLVGV